MEIEFSHLHSSILDNGVPVEVPYVVGANPLDVGRLDTLNKKPNNPEFICNQLDLCSNLCKEEEQGIEASFSRPNDCVALPRTFNPRQTVDWNKVDGGVNLVVGWVGGRHLYYRF